MQRIQYEQDPGFQPSVPADNVGVRARPTRNKLSLKIGMNLYELRGFAGNNGKNTLHSPSRSKRLENVLPNPAVLRARAALYVAVHVTASTSASAAMRQVRDAIVTVNLVGWCS